MAKISDKFSAVKVRKEKVAKKISMEVLDDN